MPTSTCRSRGVNFGVLEILSPTYKKVPYELISNKYKPTDSKRSMSCVYDSLLSHSYSIKPCLIWHSIRPMIWQNMSMCDMMPKMVCISKNLQHLTVSSSQLRMVRMWHDDRAQISISRMDSKSQEAIDIVCWVVNIARSV